MIIWDFILLACGLNLDKYTYNLVQFKRTAVTLASAP